MSREAGSRDTTVRLGGRTLAVRSRDPKLIGDVASTFYARPAPGSRPDATYDVFVDRRLTLGKRHVVTCGDELVLVTAYYPSILTALGEHAVERLLASQPELCALDASLVVKQGRGMLLVAEDGLDDGRVLLRLLDLGWLYVSQGVVLIDTRSMSFRPLERGVCVREAARPMTGLGRGGPFRDRRRLRGRYVAPAVESRCSAAVEQVGSVVFLDGGEPADQLERVARADAMERLWPRRNHGAARELFAVLIRLVRQAECWRVGRRGASRCAATLDQLADGPAAAARGGAR